MDNEKVFAMSFAKVYPMLIAKAERKSRTRAEVLEVTSWLTGYTHSQIEALLNSNLTYGDFFRKSPALNPNRSLIKGSICGGITARNKGTVKGCRNASVVEGFCCGGIAAGLDLLHHHPGAGRPGVCHFRQS